jgi:glycosyltransferase involved in cell wall biosynthesis
MKRICFVMKDVYPLFNPAVPGVFGGAEVELFFLSRALVRCGYAVQFLVGDYGQPDREERDGVCLVKLRYSNTVRYRRWHHVILRRLMIVRELVRSPAAIFLTETASDTFGFMVLINGLLRRKKVVFKCGSDVDVDYPFWKKKSRYLYLLHVFAMRYVHRIVCQSSAQQRGLDARCVAKSRVIPNAFPIPVGAPDIPRTMILWVSRWDSMKRPELFAELARRLPEERFVMIMPGSGRGREAFVRSVAGLANLSVIDCVPFHQIQAYYARAKCFVNTSTFEGFPNSFIQAGLAGTPLLSFTVNPDGIIDEHGLGCCCREDMERAVAFLRGLGPPALRRYGEHIRRYVCAYHDIDRAMPRYRQLFDELV